MTATRLGLPIILALTAAGLIAAAVWLWSPARSAPSDQTATDQLALKRVMLSTGGVAYFEFEARVDTDAVFSLPVRMDQADDVLKSVVVFDTLGQAGTIQLPSRAPLSDIFRGLPFGPDALQSSAALLEALRGAEIEVSGPASATGRVVAIDEETAQGPDDLAITRHRVSVMTAEGMRQFVLEDAVTIKFRDPLLQAQIDSALKSLAEHREGQSRTLTIRNVGNKSRIVTVGFVASAPLWKASYRLTTAPDNAKAWLQGWAVLENVSGVDWDNVELTVVTGNPVTFRQALYQTYYVDRPEVPVEVLGRILPRADEGAISAEEKPRRAAKALAPRAVPAPPPPPPAPMMAAESEAFAGGSAADQPSFDQLTAGGAVSQTKEAATQVRFTLPGKVTVRNGQSLSVAIINAQVGAETISLFQPPTHPRHPLATVRLVNDTGASLPPGVVTLYERDKAGLASFVGDARLSTLPKGESRLLSFSLDQKIIVDAERKFEQTVSKVSLANGVLKASAVDVEETAYTLKSGDVRGSACGRDHPRSSRCRR
ncbi:MAG TPA: hypothetical protein DCL54_09950, partial [Alphaproteobacteria bacterium]|nr:hypothetical protein [Alphaproteobacteria bacterium]